MPEMFTLFHAGTQLSGPGPVSPTTTTNSYHQLLRPTTASNSPCHTGDSNTNPVVPGERSIDFDASPLQNQRIIICRPGTLTRWQRHEGSLAHVGIRKMDGTLPLSYTRRVGRVQIGA